MSRQRDPAPTHRRFYPPEQESTGNFLNDFAIRGIRDVFRKSIKGAIKDGSLKVFLNEIGYDLVKRSKSKAKVNPRSNQAKKSTTGKRIGR